MTRAVSAILGAFLLSGTLAATAGAESALCAAWSGEIDPLPSVSDPDPLRATWARLRAEQLVQAAQKLEPRSKALARRAWRHASCLDPIRLDVARALIRVAPVHWVRPQILRLEETDVRRAGELPEPASEWAWHPGEPIRVVSGRVPAPETGAEFTIESPPPRFLDARAQIAAAEEAVREARFELALERVAQGRRLLEAQGPPAQRAQLEVLAATAEIALGQERAAQESLARALRAEPALRLDPALHSPKLIRLFEEVRSGEGFAP